MSGEKINLSAFFVQASASVSIACLVTLSGLICAWPSYTLENFTSNKTVLSAPISSLEISLLGSLANIGALVTTPFCGYALNTLGRKYAAMLFGVPFLIFWTLLFFTNDILLVLTATGISGIGAAGQAISSVYISEICQDSIRGAMTSLTVIGYLTGLLISYTVGGYLSYYQVIYAHLSISVLYMVLVSLLKESPVFLVQKGREEEAAKSIAFYRRVDEKSKVVDVEIRKIKLQLDPRIEKLLQAGNDITAIEELLQNEPQDNDIKPQSAWKFLLNSQSSKRALATCLILIATSIMMGSIVIQVYAEPLFKEAVPSMPSNQCSIFLAVDFIAASLLCCVVVDKLGRKFLMIVTCLTSGICALLLGSQLRFHWAPHWCTAFLIYLYCFIYNLGAAVVPFILTAEVFLPEVRGLGNSMSMGCMWMTNFIALVIFNPLVEALGLGVVFCGFSIVCFWGALYSYLYLPETKGLSADAIQVLFLKKK